MYSVSYFYPKIMGILNLAPDSFYAGSIKDAKQLFNYKEFDNTDIIDIGCESSRPGANYLPEKD